MTATASRLLLLLVLLGLLPAGAEVRTFTNTEGKTIEAEIVAVEEDTVVLKLARGRTSRVPLTTLSEADQVYARKWHEENKDKIDAGALRLEIRREHKTVRSGSGNKKNKKRNTELHTTYLCTLDSYSPRAHEDLSVTYTVYKRISTRGEGGSDTEMEEITDEIDLDTLEANGELEFETDAVVASSSSSGGNKNSKGSSRRETIVGAVFELMSGDQLVLKQSHPANFLDLLEEEEERREAREEADAKREAARDR